MRTHLDLASSADVQGLLELRAAVNRRLLEQCGEGFWIAKLTEKSMLFAMRQSSVYVARNRNRVVATLALSTRKPWAIRLDTCDLAAGAGEFYRRCGFCMVGRVSYRGVPLVYYEMSL